MSSAAHKFEDVLPDMRDLAFATESKSVWHSYDRIDTLIFSTKTEKLVAQFSRDRQIEEKFILSRDKLLNYLA